MSFGLTPRMSYKNHPLLIDFYNERGGKLSTAELEEVKGLLNGSKEDQWFVFQLLNVIDELPAEMLDLIIDAILGYTSQDNILTCVVDNLRRFFGFVDLEEKLLLRFAESKLSIQKYFICLIIIVNHIDDYYDFKNNQLQIDSIHQYEWKKDRYRKIHNTKDRKAINDYGVKLEKVLNARYALMMNTFLSEKEPLELVRLVRYRFPMREDACAKELVPLYHKAWRSLN